MKKILLAILTASTLAAYAQLTTNLPPSPIVQFWGGGRHTMVTFLIHVEQGLIHLGSERLTERDLDAQLHALYEDEIHVLAEAPIDYVRHILHVAANRALATGAELPQGYLYWRDQIGAREREFTRSLVYDYIDPADLLNDLSFSRDASKLFENPVLDDDALATRDEITFFG